jgi:hypothetical protein
MQRSREENAEIERHKYFLSEKQGYDVGWECAEQDWDAKFAESWRKQRASNNGSSHLAEVHANGGCCESAGSATACSNGHSSTTERQKTELQKTVRYDAGSRPAAGPLGKLFTKLFGK